MPPLITTLAPTSFTRGSKSSVRSVPPVTIAKAAEIDSAEAAETDSAAEIDCATEIDCAEAAEIDSAEAAAAEARDTGTAGPGFSFWMAGVVAAVATAIDAEEVCSLFTARGAEQPVPESL
jgi:hypothetical protein